MYKLQELYVTLKTILREDIQNTEKNEKKTVYILWCYVQVTNQLYKFHTGEISGVIYILKVAKCYICCVTDLDKIRSKYPPYS